MQTDIDSRMGCVSHVGALVQTHGGVSLSQHKRRQAAGLKLLAEAQRESEGDVFFRQLVAEGCAAFIASMAGVYNHEILHRS
jgi:hypothetical protein